MFYVSALKSFDLFVLDLGNPFHTAPLLPATRNVPIVFVTIADPVGAGYVDNLARPGGNATGFLLFEFRISGKWVELLKEIAPGVTRAAVIRDAAITAGIGQWSAIQALAPLVGVEVTPVPQLSVEENVLLPSWVTRGIDAARLDFVYGLLPEVAAMRDRKALVLSGGQQKLVALARALIVGTRLLLLDEPFEGVAPALSQRLAEVIGMLRGKDVAVLIAQSDLNHTIRLLDREYLIERGAAQEMGDHPRTHVTKTNETDCAHGILQRQT